VNAAPGEAAGLRERLRALRGAPTPSPLDEGIDAEWRERLARLRQLARERAGQGGLRPAAALPGREVAPGLLLEERRLGSLHARLAGIELPAELAVPWLDERKVPRERLLFFDTETSGLCGGVGLKVFLLGVLRFENEAFVLRQYLMSTPGGEGALVRAWQRELADDPVLVSYNGKRFDWPALSTLATLHGTALPAAGEHWDLLYPVRRAYRKEWPNCRLVTAEERLTGRPRKADLPGSEAPRAWREYLAHGHTGLLSEVMRHNRYDLEALLRILGHFAR
jgi:uncharacterized protein